MTEDQLKAIVQANQEKLAGLGAYQKALNRQVESLTERTAKLDGLESALANKFIALERKVHLAIAAGILSALVAGLAGFLG